jgi:hypothetical protein
MSRLLEMMLEWIGARGSYPTRVWRVLMLPVGAGMVFGWSTQRMLEGVLLGALVSVLYTGASWVWKRYLR